MEEYKDGLSGEVFQSYDEYIDFLMKIDAVGIRRCMVTTFDGKDKKWISAVTESVTDCSALRLLKMAKQMWEMQAELYNLQFDDGGDPRKPEIKFVIRDRTIRNKRRKKRDKKK